jgi:hypothetical protein
MDKKWRVLEDERMEETKVVHLNLEQRYRVCFEQAASTKGVIGWKIEANGDGAEDTMAKAIQLMQQAKAVAPAGPF